MITAINDDAKTALKHFLQKGRGNAIKKDHLARMCNLNEREMRLLINELIDDGIPICSSTGKHAGYYIAQDVKEIDEAMKTLRNYAKSAFIHRASLRKCRRVMEQPMIVLDNGQRRMI